MYAHATDCGFNMVAPPRAKVQITLPESINTDYVTIFGAASDWSKIFHCRVSYWRSLVWWKCHDLHRVFRLGTAPPRIRVPGPASYAFYDNLWDYYTVDNFILIGRGIWFGTNACAWSAETSFYPVDEMHCVGIFSYLSPQLVTTRPQYHSWPPQSANASSWALENTSSLIVTGTLVVGVGEIFLACRKLTRQWQKGDLPI